MSNFEDMVNHLQDEEKDYYLVLVVNCINEEVGFLFGSNDYPILTYERSNAREYETVEDAKIAGEEFCNRNDKYLKYIVRLSVRVDFGIPMKHGGILEVEL